MDSQRPIGPGAGEIDVDNLDRYIVRLFALVSEAAAGATHALVSGDRQAAREVVARDEVIDTLYLAVESRVEEELIERADDPDRKRYLLAVLRVLPELERSGDLAEHIAQRATRPISPEMTPRARGLAERMGEVAAAMWQLAADAYSERAPEIGPRVEELDEEMDDLHASFLAEIVGGGVPTQVAIELTLIGRFYERLGDHAFNLTRHLPLDSGSFRPKAE